ncbi:MAG: glycosyltransferase family 1 protein [Armatimonadota bacterium]
MRDCLKAINLLTGKGMKIGIDITFLFQDKRGMGRYTADLINELIKSDNKFYFLSDRDLKPYMEASKEYQGIEFIKYKNKEDISFLEAVWHPWNRIDFPGAQKNAVNIHDTLPFTEFNDNIPKSYILKDRKRMIDAASKSDMIITLSEFSKGEIVKNLSVSPEKVEVIPPGICSDFYRKNYTHTEIEALRDKFSGGHPFILYVGAPDRRKNWLGLLKAFAVLKQKHNIPHKLVIIGRKPAPAGIFSKDAEKRELIKLLKEFTSKGELFLIEEVNSIDLVNLYNITDVFVFPSFYEGFGLTVVEAQICGAPVVTSSSASLPEASGRGALMCDPHNYEDIAEKIYKVLRDENFKKELVGKGLENAAKFSYTNCAVKMLRAFKELEGEGNVKV